MLSNEITIKVTNERIYLNPNLFIPMEQSNIPKDYLTFRTSKEIFWKVKIVDYDANEKGLKLLVKDYDTKERIDFDRQKTTKEIEYIAFEKFNWRGLEAVLSDYKVFLKEQLSSDNRKSQTFSNVYYDTYKYRQTKFIRMSEMLGPSKTKREPLIKEINQKFTVRFSDIKFQSGYVVFKKHIKTMRKDIEFKIHNEYIQAEFENVKQWFTKKLRTKKIEVNAVITLTDFEITQVEATSAQIQQISAELIESIKEKRTISLSKVTKMATANKSLYSADEIFNFMDTDDKEGNVFSQNEGDILDFFLAKGNVRNKRQLNFLAEMCQTEEYKLRYTIKPNFGFLFMIKGKNNNHFVWELLNSNATYIWSIKKDKDDAVTQYKRIEDAINTIRLNGRESYKRAYSKTEIDSDILFNKIYHIGIDSNPQDDFSKWKVNMTDYLT